MASDIFDDSAEYATDYEQLWQNPEVQVMMRRHFTEQLSAGIFTTYNSQLPQLIKDVNEPEEVDSLIKQILSAELPFVVVADIGVDGTEDAAELEWAVALGLVKVNPTTGQLMWESFMCVGEVDEGRIAEVYEPFSQQQAELILRQGNEQIRAGLHPYAVFRQS